MGCQRLSVTTSMFLHANTDDSTAKHCRHRSDRNKHVLGPFFFFKKNRQALNGNLNKKSILRGHFCLGFSQGVQTPDLHQGHMMSKPGHFSEVKSFNGEFLFPIIQDILKPKPPAQVIQKQI